MDSSILTRCRDLELLTEPRALHRSEFGAEGCMYPKPAPAHGRLSGGVPGNSIEWKDEK